MRIFQTKKYAGVLWIIMFLANNSYFDATTLYNMCLHTSLWAAHGVMVTGEQSSNPRQVCLHFT